MALVLVSLFFAGLLTTAIRSPRSGLFVAVFLAPWMGLDADLGLRVTGYRLAVVALVIALGIRMVEVKRAKRSIQNNNHFLTAFIAYAFFLSVFQMFLLPTVSLDSGLLRSGLLRPIAQIFMFALMIASIFIIPRIVQKHEDIIKCGKIYLWSVSVLAVLGWIQLLVWYGTGTDPFPIGVVGSLVSGSKQTLRSGIDHVGSIPVYRMCSFGGEPKGLAQGVAVGLLILQSGVTSISAVSISKRKVFLLWGFLMLSLLFTWSTSGMFLWIIGTFTITLVGFGGMAKKRNQTKFVIGIICLSVVITTFWIVPFDRNRINSTGVISIMVKKRFIERNPIEDFDEVILAFLNDQPEYLVAGVGLGNVHIYAKKYISPLAMYYMADNIFVAKSGYLRIISELGIIGLLLFIFAVLRILSLLYFATQKMLRRSKEKILGNILFAVGIVALAGGMARTYIWPQMFLVLGLCTTYPVILHRQRLFKVSAATVSRSIGCKTSEDSISRKKLAASFKYKNNKIQLPASQQNGMLVDRSEF